MELSPVLLILAHAAVLFALAIASIAVARSSLGRWLVYGGALLSCALALVVALQFLLLDPLERAQIVLRIGIPWIGARFAIDSLSAFFLVLTNLGGALASLYALGYGRHESQPARVLPFYAIFIGAMNLVLVAADAFAFLVSWEFMSLASWALVLAHHRAAENRRAAYVYIVMASFGTLALLLGFGLMAGPQGHFAFEAIRAHHLSQPIGALALMLALVGTGSKAGLYPLHVWLPLAHPAAPSHVSALMSGVMTKIAIYGFVRIAFDLLGPPVWWWSVPIIAIGALSAVLGILQALFQNDFKRVLAFSTIENIGVIFVGLGLALAFAANGMAAASALALTAALFHAFNHSLFKSLLFFVSGAVLVATGERDMGKMGGLLGRMPATGLLFLIGAVAISSLPPLNGFASEWLLLQSILLSPDLPQWSLKLLVPVAGTLLALATAFASACFIRAYGISFLGRPRSVEAETAKEVDRFSIAAMGLLALGCILAGLLPALVIDSLAPLAHMLVGKSMPLQIHVEWLTIVPIAESRSSYNALLVFIFIAASAMLAAFAIHRVASKAVRRAPPWACGQSSLGVSTQYSPESFSQPIRRVFAGSVFGAHEEVDMPAPGDDRPAHFALTIQDYAWRWIYNPLSRVVLGLADRFNRLQYLTIRQYLSGVFASLIILLVLLAGAA